MRLTFLHAYLESLSLPCFFDLIVAKVAELVDAQVSEACDH